MFFNSQMSKGRVPRPLLWVYVIPLDKPNKKQEHCSPKRPISLINTLAKVLEAVIYHRLLPLFEPHLDPYQYAYRRHCSTEMHVAEMADFAASAVRAGDWV